MRLADAKRKLTVGTKVTLVWHKHATGWRMFTETPEAQAERDALVSGKGVTRVVALAQTNAVAFAHAEDSQAVGNAAIRDHARRLSWLYWPKASEFESTNNWEFTILENDEPLMKYRIEEAR